MIVIFFGKRLVLICNTIAMEHYQLKHFMSNHNQAAFFISF